MRNRMIRLAGAISILLVVDSAPGGVAGIYYSDIHAGAEHIGRTNLDGSGMTSLIADTGNTRSIFITDTGLYWARRSVGEINRSDLDGSNTTTLVSDSILFPQGLAVTDDTIFWSSQGVNKIRKSNLDGSNVSDLVNESAFPQGMSAHDGSIYWVRRSSGSGAVRRANEDGTNVESVINTGFVLPQDVFVTDDYIYWAEQGAIRRADHTGANAELVVGASADSIFVTDQHVYWTLPSATVGQGVIRRANLDGSDIVNVVTGLTQVRALHVVVPAAPTATLLLPAVGLGACGRRRSAS